MLTLVIMVYNATLMASANTNSYITKTNSNKNLCEIFWEVLYNYLQDFPQYFFDFCRSNMYVKMIPTLFSFFC